MGVEADVALVVLEPPDEDRVAHLGQLGVLEGDQVAAHGDGDAPQWGVAEQSWLARYQYAVFLDVGGQPGLCSGGVGQEGKATVSGEAAGKTAVVIELDHRAALAGSLALCVALVVDKP